MGNLPIPILSFMILMPIIGALFIFLTKAELGDGGNRNARLVALWATIVTFLTSLYVAWRFDWNHLHFQFVEYISWIAPLNIHYHIGIDQISLMLILLTTFLMPLCILASWTTIQFRTRQYMVLFLLLESLMIATFCALDTVLFYIFFEATLIPMFFIIGIWGGSQRIYAAFKFFLYTLAGSLLMLLAILYLAHATGSTNYLDLLKATIDPHVQTWLWLAFFASFAVKIPMWPLHTWLPDAHVEAPVAGSVILAGVLLKMGGYGMIRFMLPVLPDACHLFQPFIFALSIIAIIYTGLVALAQHDIKKLIAYSSVAHMGFVTLGLFSFTPHGISGAMVQMLSHGLISGGLFLGVGVLYERLHSRDIKVMGGIANAMPVFAALYMVIALGNAGLPGTSGFVGEILALMGTFKVSVLWTLVAATGMVIGAAYTLTLYRGIFYDTARSSYHVAELTLIERTYLWPIVLAVIIFGLFPSPMLTVLTKPISLLLR